ncbi:MAG: hypothetical protein ACYC8T_04600 [Myxococcaceae bacterium]
MARDLASKVGCNVPRSLRRVDIRPQRAFKSPTGEAPMMRSFCALVLAAVVGGCRPEPARYIFDVIVVDKDNGTPLPMVDVTCYTGNYDITTFRTCATGKVEFIDYVCSTLLATDALAENYDGGHMRPVCLEADGGQRSTRYADKRTDFNLPGHDADYRVTVEMDRSN